MECRDPALHRGGSSSSALGIIGLEQLPVEVAFSGRGTTDQSAIT
jgi:hypothetical protein